MLIARRWKEELRRRGIEIRALNLQVDPATPEGKLMEHVQEAFDQYQSDSTGWWVSVGLQERFERGLPLGRLPEYLVKDPDGTIRPHAVLAPIIREGAARYLTNANGADVGFSELAAWSRLQGYATPRGSPLDDEWWRNVLGQPQVAGMVAYKRKQARARGGVEPMQGKWEPIVAPEDWLRIQQLRRARTRLAGKPLKDRVYPLSDAACGSCGSKVDSLRERPHALPISGDAPRL